MKTIKIFLNEDGTFRNGLTPDFNLNQYSWQDTLLNVYVPTSIVDLQTGSTGVVAMFKSYDSEGELVEEITNNKYNFAFVRSGIFRPNDTTEYALFERIMPKQMTLYAGQQVLVLNVVEYNLQHELTNIVTSGEATYNVVASAIGEETTEETDLASIQAQINALQSAVQTLTSDKQSKVDARIVVYTDATRENTTNQVVQALNCLNSRLGPVESQTATNTQDIEEIKASYILDLNYIGQYSSENPPTQETLTSVGLQLKGSPLENGDTLLWVEQKLHDTDVVWKCTYVHTNDWVFYAIPSVESASNDTLGIIQGTTQADGKNIIVDIVSGKVNSLYIKTDTNTFTDISLYAQSVLTILNSILDGTAVVGKSTKAIQDQYGNVIDTTYMPVSSGATQEFVKNYALPNLFNDTYRVNFSNSTINLESYGNITVRINTGEVPVPITTLTWVFPNYKFTISSGNTISLKLNYTNPEDTADYSIPITIVGTLKKSNQDVVLFTATKTIDVSNNSIDTLEMSTTMTSLSAGTNVEVEENDYIEIAISQTYLVSGGSQKLLQLVSAIQYPSTAMISVNYGTISFSEGVVGEQLRHYSDNANLSLDTTIGRIIFTNQDDLINNTEHEFVVSFPASLEGRYNMYNPQMVIHYNGVDYNMRSMNNYLNFCKWEDLHKHRCYSGSTANQLWRFKVQYDSGEFIICESNNYRDSLMEESIMYIVNGTTTVGEATKATQDGSGNTITSTYATKSELALEENEPIDALTLQQILV